MARTKHAKREKTRQNWPQPNPALKDLAVLAGEWDMELSNSTFLPNPSDTVKGHAAFAWVEDGAFLEMRQGNQPSAPPQAIWLINRDESSGGYEAFYYDGRGVSRIYQMSFDGDVWKMWRDSPGFSQRYEGKISDDHDTISAHWEKSTDDRQWEHDFDITYTRTK